MPIVATLLCLLLSLGWYVRSLCLVLSTFMFGKGLNWDSTSGAHWQRLSVEIFSSRCSFDNSTIIDFQRGRRSARRWRYHQQFWRLWQCLEMIGFRSSLSFWSFCIRLLNAYIDKVLRDIAVEFCWVRDPITALLLDTLVSGILQRIVLVSFLLYF